MIVYGAEPSWVRLLTPGQIERGRIDRWLPLSSSVKGLRRDRARARLPLSRRARGQVLPSYSDSIEARVGGATRGFAINGDGLGASRERPHEIVMPREFPRP
jgi:hypothetical protein